jgi:membrane-bound metal-dependent hydrolase YbcI (DUF457 family)
MDVLAHTLWTNAVFHIKYHQNRKMRYLAAFFGVVPDLIGFAPMFIYLVLSGRIFSGERFPFANNNWTFGFAAEAYNYTHSIVIWALGFILVSAIVIVYKYFTSKQLSAWVFWPMLGWSLHIFIDFFTHPDFYRTPILFPLSSYKNSHGISWAHPIFMIVNYLALVLVYIILTRYKKREQV